MRNVDPQQLWDAILGPVVFGRCLSTAPPSCLPLQVGERIGVDGEHPEDALADADAVLGRQVDEFVAVDERDRGSAAGPCCRAGRRMRRTAGSTAD